VGTIIPVASSKGGSSKTTTTTLLSTNLAAMGYRVAVIDADANEAFYTWATNSYEGPQFDTTKCIDHSEIVAHALGQGEDHDVTLIDCPGFSNQTSAYAMGVADLVIIPVMADRNSVIEARRTARQCEGIAKLARREIPYRVLLSRWNRRGLAERATLEDLEAAQLVPLRQHVPDLSDFKKSTFTGVIQTKGTVGRYAHSIIQELVELGAVPAKPERKAA
jgi:chromosome partitioning protein